MVLKVEYKTNCYKEENYKKNSFLNFRSTLEIMFNKKTWTFHNPPPFREIACCAPATVLLSKFRFKGGAGSVQKWTNSYMYTPYTFEPQRLLYTT